MNFLPAGMYHESDPNIDQHQLVLHFVRDPPHSSDCERFFKPPAYEVNTKWLIIFSSLAVATTEWPSDEDSRRPRLAPGDPFSIDQKSYRKLCRLVLVTTLTH